MKGPATATLALNGVESYEIETKANGVAKPEKTKEGKEAILLSTPFGKVDEALEKKLRNLEKRRQKQQQLKQELQSGKTLTDEQREAVLMINEVERQIEWIKEVQKMTQQQGRQYQRAIKQRDEVERKKGLENTIEDIKLNAQLRELLTILKKDEVKEAFAKGSDGTVALNEEELRILDELHGLLKPLGDFNSFAEWHAHLGDSAKKIYFVVKGVENEVFTNVNGATVKQLLEKIAASEMIRTLGFKKLDAKNESNDAQSQENVIERENVSASPSLSTVSSQKTESSQSQTVSETSRQSPTVEDTHRSTESPEAKVVFVANDSSQNVNGTCEGQFVFAAEPVTGGVVQNVPVTFIPGPTPVFVPVVAIPAPPVSGVITPEVVPTVASPYVPTQTEPQNVNNTNGNSAPKNHRRRDGNRNGDGNRNDGNRREGNRNNFPRGPNQNRGPGGPRPYRQQSSRDSNSDSSNTEPKQRNGDNFRPRPNQQAGGNGGFRGNRGGQQQNRDTQPQKPKYQYGFRFAEN